MNSTDSTKKPEEPKAFKPNILIMGVGAAATFATAYLLRKKSMLPPKPPPIIIKSGSFVIETDQDLKPAAPHQSRYIRETFGKIRGIRVTTYSEIEKPSDVDDFEENIDWSPSEGVQVNINLQYYQAGQNSGYESWIQGPQIKIFDIDNNFELITPIKLSSNKGKKHKERRAKREDEENQILRFGSVEIVKKSSGKRIKNYSEKDGREYIIAFYNGLR